MATAFTNARVLTSEGFWDDVAVLVDNGVVAAIVDADDARVRDADVRDLGGDYLFPGFIDCQVNGGGDVLFNDAPTVETIRRIGAAHRKFGTTGFLPTLISGDADVMRAAIAAVDAAIAERVPGVLGIHLEGPYLAPARKGVHDAT
jgi:N-acetylglucosamine-6-phosphate deacetylase